MSHNCRGGACEVSSLMLFVVVVRAKPQRPLAMGFSAQDLSQPRCPDIGFTAPDGHVAAEVLVVSPTERHIVDSCGADHGRTAVPAGLRSHRAIPQGVVQGFVEATAS